MVIQRWRESSLDRRFAEVAGVFGLDFLFVSGNLAESNENRSTACFYEKSDFSGAEPHGDRRTLLPPMVRMFRGRY
jgi:hypothetical protein